MNPCVMDTDKALWRCEACGQSWCYAGLPINLAIAFGRAFGKEHARCSDNSRYQNVKEVRQ